MTTIKLDTKLNGSATIALDELVSPLFANPGMRFMAVVEFAAVERTQPAPDEEKDASVKVAIKGIEVGRGEQANHLRTAMAALHRHRTATGTLDDEMGVNLSDRTVELTGGVLDQVEAARLRVALVAHAEYISRIERGDMTLSQMRAELRTVRQGLESSARWTYGA